MGVIAAQEDRKRPSSATPTRRIGIDLDNTIACFDELFVRAARDEKLVPDWIQPNKTTIRDYLRSQGKEHDWTRLQGIVYGERMPEASPFPGVHGFLARSMELGAQVYIVSHRTRHPEAGQRWDLHRSALEWLKSNQLIESATSPVREPDVFLEVSRSDKLARIATLECTHFVDDLVEVLGDPRMPASTRGILFDPHGSHLHRGGPRIRCWDELDQMLW
ncbi:MAG: hypothetical protein V2A73_03335 [Pseudomonadota bacterium]